MGEQIKLVRLRRKLSAELAAERASISRSTLWAIEKGSPSVAIGMYAAVLHALNGMEAVAALWCESDSLWGRIVFKYRYGRQCYLHGACCQCCRIF